LEEGELEMVYNNGYPASYQPMVTVPQPSYNGYQQMQSNVPARSNTNVVWIQGGLQTAKAYPIEPNTNLIMIDMAEMMAYSKFADGNGMQTPIEQYSIQKVVADDSYYSQAIQPMATDNLATKDDLQTLFDEIASMKQMIQQEQHSNSFDRRGDTNVER
jgi:hypothetical protein